MSGPGLEEWRGNITALLQVPSLYPGPLGVMIGWNINSSKRRGLTLNDFEDGGRDSRESRRSGRLVLVLQGAVAV